MIRRLQAAGYVLDVGAVRAVPTAGVAVPTPTGSLARRRQMRHDQQRSKQSGKPGQGHKYIHSDDVIMATRCEYQGGHPQLPHGRFAYLLLEGTREDPNITIGFPAPPELDSTTTATSCTIRTGSGAPCLKGLPVLEPAEWI